MKDSDKELGSLLRFDPLSTAEKITGESYKDESKGTGFDNPTMALGFGLAMTHNQMKDAELRERDDTTFSNTYARYVRILADEGFELVLQDAFEGWHYDEGYLPELFEIWFHPDGILLHFDTYTSTRQRGPQTNSSKFQYVVQFEAGRKEERWNVISSGRFLNYDSGIWSGNHDGREALRFHIRGLREYGKFLNPWPENHEQFWWLLHWGETYTAGHQQRESYAPWDREHGKLFDPETMYDYETLALARIARLPQHVRDCIRA